MIVNFLQRLRFLDVTFLRMLNRKQHLLDGIFTLFSIIYTGVIFLFSYFGLVEWFVLTFSLLITLLVSLVSNTLSNWSDCPNRILLFLAMIPIFELMISINLSIFTGFFRQIDRLSPSTIAHFVDVSWRTNSILSRLHVIASFVIGAIFLVLLILSITAFVGHPTAKYVPIAICGCSGVTPVLAVLRVFLACWQVLVWPRPSPLSTVYDAVPSETVGQLAFIIPNGDDIPLINPLDAIGLIPPSNWIVFVRDRSSILTLLRAKKMTWRYIPAAIIFGVWTALLVTDIIRQVRFERCGLDLVMQEFVSGLPGVICHDFCIGTEVLLHSTNETAFCLENCSARPETHVDMSHIPLKHQISFIAFRVIFFLMALPFIVGAIHSPLTLKTQNKSAF
jgi:hypothetical protein